MVIYVGSGKWSFDEIISCGPEEFVAAQLAAVGFRCRWCEGMTLGANVSSFAQKRKTPFLQRDACRGRPSSW